jgi:CPA1 family monovalent cation:H+ antiporter
VAPFTTYLVAEEVHGSGVIAVVVAALILGQRSTRAGYATRLQDTAVWKALQLILESFAFLLIGLQLPEVVGALAGLSAAVIITSSVAVLGTVIGVRILWVYLFTYVPWLLSPRIREREPAPTPAQVFIVAWAGMRGVVSLAAAFAVPMTTLSGAPFPGRPHLVFLTFVVVIGTLLLHGVTLPWLIRVLGGQGGACGGGAPRRDHGRAPPRKHIGRPRARRGSAPQLEHPAPQLRMGTLGPRREGHR